MELDHEKLDVYRVSLDFTTWAYDLCRNLKGPDRLPESSFYAPRSPSR